MNTVLTFTPEEMESLQWALTSASLRFHEKSEAENRPVHAQIFETAARNTDKLWSRIYHAQKRAQTAA